MQTDKTAPVMLDMMTSVSSDTLTRPNIFVFLVSQINQKSLEINQSINKRGGIDCRRFQSA
jgi:hypothetical protein